MQEGMLALYRKNNRLRIRMEKAIIRRTGMRMWSGKELVRLWVEKFLNICASHSRYFSDELDAQFL